MGKQFENIPADIQQFIEKQKIFFVGTAMEDGRVNVSPKGLDTFRVVNANRVAWLNLTGSGNETATHLKNNDRMTIMFCSFDRNPRILRLYGHAKVYHDHDKEWGALLELFPKYVGCRQIIDMHIDLVQTSCGYAVPMMEFAKERDTLHKWAEKKGKAGIQEYQKENNRTSLDGHNTGLNKENKE